MTAIRTAQPRVLGLHRLGSLTSGMTSVGSSVGSSTGGAMSVAVISGLLTKETLGPCEQDQE